mgnify:FL=1|tara:strand:- start:8779 stop:9207 length:429 start_codon:yes stop_codon:yes gene_type:complete
MVRPRYTDVSDEAVAMFQKAQQLLERADTLEKAKVCPECGETANKAACVKAGCGTMAKAQPDFSTSFNTEPQNVTFVAESGGQTRNAYYTTNNYTLDVEDVANKGATSQSYNMDALSARVNTHDRPVESHEIDTGGKTPTTE